MAIKRRKPMPKRIVKQTLSEKEILALGKAYADDQGITLVIDPNAKTFSADPINRVLKVPEGKITANPVHLLHGIRHEAIHLKETDASIMNPVLDGSKTLYYVSQMLEDIRVESIGQRDYPGAASVNWINYHQKQYQGWRPEAGKKPTIDQYIFSMRHKALFPSESLGFDLDPRLIDILKEVRTIPTCERQVELMKETDRIVREVFKTEKTDEERPNGNPNPEDGNPNPEDGNPNPEDGNPNPEDGKGSGVEEIKDDKDLEDRIQDLEKMIKDSDPLTGKGITVREDREILTKETRDRFRDLVRSIGQTNSPEDILSLNQDSFELGLGLGIGDPDLVFKGPESYEEKPIGSLVILLDSSASMRDQIDYDLHCEDRSRKINGEPYRKRRVLSCMDYCAEIVRELSNLENKDFKVAVIQWDSYARVVKNCDGDLKMVRAKGGTRAGRALKKLEKIASSIPAGPTLLLWITDGAWSVPIREDGTFLTDADHVEGILRKAEEIIPDSTCGVIGISDTGIGLDQFENIAKNSRELSDCITREIERLEKRMI